MSIFTDMKMKSVHKYAFFKINDAQTEIVVEKTGQGQYSDFIAELPAVSVGCWCVCVCVCV